MQIIPLQPLPNQSLQVQLNNQACTLNIRQFAYGLFMDVYVASTLIIAGVICEDRNRIVRSAYLGFIGDFVFADTQGTDDPVFSGLGSRFLLAYVTEDEIAAAVA